MSERWVEFEGRPNGAVRGSRPRVTLSDRYVLLLNKRAVEMLEWPAAVKLKFEEDKRVIGLVAADPGHKNSFPLKKDNRSCRQIYIRPFCRHWGIDIARTVLFNEVDTDDNGMMRLALNETVGLGKRRQNRER
jgi:hypothetical protein